MASLQDVGSVPPCRRRQAACAPLRPARSLCRSHLARRTRRRRCEPEGRALGGFTRRLSGHAPALNAASRHFLFHAGVRKCAACPRRVVVQDRVDVPTELWRPRLICSDRTLELHQRKESKNFRIPRLPPPSELPALGPGPLSMSSHLPFSISCFAKLN